MTEYYKKIDWPSVPLDLEKELIEYAATATPIAYPGKPPEEYINRIKKYIETHKVIPSYGHYEGPDSLKKWVRENIPIPETFHIKLQQFSNFIYVPIHVDHVRLFSYNYLFFESKAVTGWFDKDDNLLESVCYEHHKWYKHNSAIPHNVTNIHEKRIAITLFEQTS